MSDLSRAVRCALVAGTAGIASMNFAACSDGSTAPRSTAVPVSPSMPAVLSSSERATLDSLRAPRQWIADLHHQAMQEVLHDPNIARYTGHGPRSAACLAQSDYMVRYAHRLETLAATAHGPQGEAMNTNTLATRVGVCQASTDSRVASPNTAVG